MTHYFPKYRWVRVRIANESYLDSNLPKIRIYTANTFKKYIIWRGGWHLGPFKEWEESQPFYVSIGRGIVKALNTIALTVKDQGGQPLFAKMTSAQIEAPEEQPKLLDKTVE